MVHCATLCSVRFICAELVVAWISSNSDMTLADIINLYLCGLNSLMRSIVNLGRCWRALLMNQPLKLVGDEITLYFIAHQDCTAQTVHFNQSISQVLKCFAV